MSTKTRRKKSGRVAPRKKFRVGDKVLMMDPHSGLWNKTVIVTEVRGHGRSYFVTETSTNRSFLRNNKFLRPMPSSLLRNNIQQPVTETLQSVSGTQHSSTAPHSAQPPSKCVKFSKKALFITSVSSTPTEFAETTYQVVSTRCASRTASRP